MIGLESMKVLCTTLECADFFEHATSVMIVILIKFIEFVVRIKNIFHWLGLGLVYALWRGDEGLENLNM